jgi:4-amino-4-deoxychorismate lyase
VKVLFNGAMEKHSFISSIDGLLASSDSLIDRGLAYGHGLFETMRLHLGQLPLRSRHLERLMRDAAVLGIPVHLSTVEQCINDFQQHLRQQNIDHGVIKLIVTAGTGGRGYKNPATIKARIICVYSELPQFDQQGIHLWHCDYRLPSNSVLSGIKHLNRLDQVIARNEWTDDFYADGLMFDQSNHLVETTSANIFLHSPEQGWITPNLHSAGVSGVMRAVLLDELFPRLDIAVSTVDISVEQLVDCDQMFTCNSVRGITPVLGFIQNHNLVTLTIGSEIKMLQSSLADNYPCFK